MSITSVFRFSKLVFVDDLQDPVLLSNYSGRLFKIV